MLLCFNSMDERQDEAQPIWDAFHKLGILKFAEDIGSVVKACRYFRVGRVSFYCWKAAYEKSGKAGLVDRPSTPFRIREVRTENGHEFQAKFHCHVEDQGIRHVYIKPASPQLNGKLDEWETFYNFARPHGAFKGKAPYETLRERL